MQACTTAASSPSADRCVMLSGLFVDNSGRAAHPVQTVPLHTVIRLDDGLAENAARASLVLDTHRAMILLW